MIVPRSKWAVREIHRSPLPIQPATHVFIHHAVSAVDGSTIDLDNDGLPDSFEAIVRQIEDFHMDTRGWSAIAYNFLVGHRGTRAEGRGWGWEGGATGDWADDRGISICAIGDYHTKHRVTKKLIRAIVLTIADGIEDGHLVPINELWIGGHQQKPYATACPGQRLMKVVPSLKGRVTKELTSRRRKRNIRKRIQRLRAKIQELRKQL